MALQIDWEGTRLTTSIKMRGITTIDLAMRTRRRRGYIKEDEITYDAATIIALDPGGTTGWSLISVHPEALTTPDASVLENIFVHQHGQVDCGSHRGNLATSLHSGISTDGEFSGVYDIVKLIREWPCAAVVIEDFVLRQMRMDRELLSPVRITSAIGYQLWKSGRDYHIQSPSDAKRVCTDDRLKNWQMYDPTGGLQHARDADRHAILFLRKAKAKANFRAKAWPHLFGERGAYSRTA
jgi:hypothetical protein